MSELALKLIRKIKEERATFIDLRNCGLTEIPQELFELEWLEEVNLGVYFYNSYTQKFQLSKNAYSKNDITNISENIKNLKKLQALYISYNKITDISALEGLARLTKLYLYSNQIRDISVLKALPDLLSFSYLEIRLGTSLF